MARNVGPYRRVDVTGLTMGGQKCWNMYSTVQPVLKLHVEIADELRSSNLCVRFGAWCYGQANEASS